LHEATGNWNLYREADRLPALEIDLAKFADYLHLLEQGKHRLRQYVDELAQPTLHITYEDLLLDFEGTMAQVLDFLGTPPERVVSGAKKITSDDLRLAVSNFWELRAQYAGTAYEPMFDEVLTEEPACSASLAMGEPAPFRTQGGEETANVIDSGSIARTNLGRGKKPDYERFIILGQERTGSNLLLLLLSSHPNARTFGEVFNPSEDVRRRSIGPARPPDLAENPAEYLANCIYRAYPEHIRAVGFKLFYSHARNKEWKAAWAYLRRTGVRVIHITRRNLLDRYLSLQLALSSEEWIALDGNESTYYEPIPLNAKACLRDFQRSVSLQQRMDQFFVHNPKLTVIYEDLCNDMTGECQRVQAFLGLEPMTLSSTLKKQRTQSKREIIANFDDLKETIAAWVSKGWAKEEWLGFFEEEACD
jgi:LPS sulfotransferase NodH